MIIVIEQYNRNRVSKNENQALPNDTKISAKKLFFPAPTFLNFKIKTTTTLNRLFCPEDLSQICSGNFRLFYPPAKGN